MSAYARALALNPLLREAARYALPDIALNGGMGKEASFRELCRTLDGYRFNTIFEELGSAAFDIVADMDVEDIRPRGLMNPVPVIVAFYEEMILTGRMVPPPLTLQEQLDSPDDDEETQPDGDLWIETQNKSLVDPVMDVWKWSNFQTKMSQIAGNAANYGNCLLVVTEEDDKVFIEIRHPAELVDYDRHPRGHLTYAKIETDTTERDPLTMKLTHHTVTVEYTKEWIKTFRDGQPYKLPGYDVNVWENPHGFVPVEMIRHTEIPGDDRGLNAYHAGLAEINEMNIVASVIGTLITKHISPQWAALGAAAPEDGEEIDRSDAIWFLPGGTSLQQIIADLDIAGAYQHIDSIMDRLETKFPELMLPKVGDQKRDISGAAVRGILTGLIRRGLKARENYEHGIKSAVQMALSMGANIGGTGRSLWEGVTLGDYGSPEREFEFHWPDILPMNKLERLKLRNDEKALELAIVNLQMQIDEAKRKVEVARRLAEASVIDPITGFPIDPLTLAVTDPTTLQPVVPTVVPAENTPVPGAVGAASGNPQAQNQGGN